MERLGYTRYVAQGGDWGNAVTEQMALLKPAGTARHSHQHAGDVPPDISKALAAGGAGARRSLRRRAAARRDQLDYFYKHGLGYANEMANRPQTLYAHRGLPGRPGRLDARSRRSAATQLIARVFAGDPRGLTRDDVLDNVTLYWLTNTAVSSARLYWESKLAVLRVQGRRRSRSA